MVKERFYNTFSSGVVSLILLSALILVNIWHQEYFRNFKPDKCRQIHSAYQIQEGKGYSKCNTDSLTLKSEICSPELAWPAGYSYFLSAVNSSVKDFYKTSMLIEYFALFGFYATFILLLLALETHRITLNFLLLFFTVSFSPIHYLTTTCLLSLISLMGTVIAFLYFEKEKLNGVLTGILMGIFMFLSTFFRFAYYPVTAGILFFLCWKIIETQNFKKYIAPALVFTFVYGLLYFYAQSLYDYTPAKGALQIADFGKGFYPQNLLKADDFITKFFFFLNPVYTIIEGNSFGDYHHPFSYLLRIIGLTITFLITFIYIKKGIFSLFKEQSMSHSFNTLGLITLGTTVIPYLYLSLITIAFQVGTLANYTYVQETRYYAPLIPFIMIFVANYAFGKERFSCSFRIGLGIATFTGVMMSSAIFYKVMFSDTPLQGTYDYYYRRQIENYQTLTLEKAKYPNERWVYADSTQEPNPLIVLSGCEVYNGDFLKNIQGKNLPDNTFLICPASFADKIDSVLLAPVRTNSLAVEGWVKISCTDRTP
ncbi:MAG: hypothetical protein K1X92_00795 [Bacteroidia bacterium]|nr:hypothetical protein [Bacteroidia bacterium]